MKALPLGSYISRQTPLHSLDARIKLILLLGVTIALFICHTWYGLGCAGAVLICLIAISGVSAQSVVRALRPAAVVLVLSLLGNAFVLSQADIAFADMAGLSFSGLTRGLTAVMRIIILVGYSLVICSTTTSTALAEAVSSLLKPLKLLGVPVDDLSMILMVALRFIPLVAEELDRIATAQRARGAKLSDASIIERLRAWTTVFVPLIVSLFRRSDELASAMRDRCWGAGTRTSYETKLKPRDIVTLLCGIALCAVVAVL